MRQASQNKKSGNQEARGLRAMNRQCKAVMKRGLAMRDTVAVKRNNPILVDIIDLSRLHMA